MKKTTLTATLRGTKATVIPRSQVQCDYRYEVQTQAPAGNWVMSMAASEWNTVAEDADHLIKLGHTVRIVDNSANYQGA